jgi:hypothetical protein
MRGRLTVLSLTFFFALVIIGLFALKQSLLSNPFEDYNLLIAVVIVSFFISTLFRYLQDDEPSPNRKWIENISIHDSKDKILKAILAEPKTIYEKIGSDLNQSSEKKFLLDVFEHTASRIGMEINSLRRRANLNLVLGITITIIGLIILWYYVVYTGHVTDNKNIESMEYFIPRFSLVILIEVFAYFFLRLYKNSLSEIKYFQNELTNIESKLLSVVMVLSNANDVVRNKFILLVAKTDRNNKDFPAETDEESYKTISKLIEAVGKN